MTQTTLHKFFAPEVLLAPHRDHTERTRVQLDREQNDVVQAVVDDGLNVFYTGAAGTGKSLVTRAIIQRIRSRGREEPAALAVTASTGVAAANVGGSTIHFWSGVASSDMEFSSIMDRVRGGSAKLRWGQVKAIIIDEISMLDADYFDVLCDVARAMRPGSNKPFGGIQLIVTGDFFQLPPVSKKNPRTGKVIPARFAFESDQWRNVFQREMRLTKVYRQRDFDFVTALNDIRRGEVSDKTLQMIKGLERALPSATVLPIYLYSRRDEAAQRNDRCLDRLDGDMFLYETHDRLTSNTDDALAAERSLKQLPVEPTLRIKVGAQVMLIKNYDESLVNGATGVVVRMETDIGFSTDDLTRIGKHFNSADKYPVVKFMTTAGDRMVLVGPEEFRAESGHGNVLAIRVQLPLILAWAISIHKSQGQTLQRVQVNLQSVFEKGQVYVALSRAASVDGLQVVGFKRSKVMVDRRVLDWDRKMQGSAAVSNGNPINPTATERSERKRLFPRDPLEID